MTAGHVERRDSDPPGDPLNEHAAALLDETARLLEEQYANAFRVEAYRNAANTGHGREVECERRHCSGTPQGQRIPDTNVEIPPTDCRASSDATSGRVIHAVGQSYDAVSRKNRVLAAREDDTVRLVEDSHRWLPRLGARRPARAAAAIRTLRRRGQCGRGER
jgi:hypothetical protein